MTSFAEGLYGMSTDRLRALIQTRNIEQSKLSLTPTKRQLVQYLAAELSRPHSVAQAILTCNARELRFLQLTASYASSQGNLRWASLLEAAGGKDLDETLRRVAVNVENLGLAFLIDDTVFMPDCVRSQVPISLPDQYTLDKCLNAYDNQAIKRVYSNLGLGNDPGTKQQAIDAIRKHLLSPEIGKDLARPFDKAEIAVLEFLTTVGGCSTAADVAITVLPEQNDDFFRYDWQNRWKLGKERNAIDRLLARGLLHVISYGYAYNLYLVIPGDLFRNLTGNMEKSIWTLAPPMPKRYAEPVAAVRQHTALIRDVIGLLAFVTAQEALRTSTGYMHKSSLKALARGLTLPDERYAGFIYAVAREAKLIDVDWETSRYNVTPAGDGWLASDAVSQAETLYDAWRKGVFWAEMCNDPLYKDGQYRSQELVLRMRHATLDLIAEAATESAVEVASLTDALAFRRPLLLSRSESFGSDLVSTPATFVRRLIGDCLFWLGTAELGYKEPIGPEETRKTAGAAGRGKAAAPAEMPEAVSYRLTDLGANLLHVAGAPSAAAASAVEDKFILQANAEVFVPPYLDASLLYRLLLLTESPTKGAASGTFALTRESIRRALDAGWSQNEILSFFQTNSRTGIPQNIEYLINEVADRYGHIHIGTASMYISTDTPLLLKELQARRELKGYFVRTLSDTVALMESDNPEKLLRELRKAGYLPVSDDEEPRMKRPTPHAGGSETTAAAGAVQSAAVRAKRAETSVDWNRIAQDDDTPWAKDATPGKKVTPAVERSDREIQAIQSLLADAARTKQQVRIEYEGQDASRAWYLIEPKVVVGSMVSAYIPESDSYLSFNIKRIVSSALMGPVADPT